MSVRPSSKSDTVNYLEVLSVTMTICFCWYMIFKINITFTRLQLPPIYSKNYFSSDFHLVKTGVWTEDFMKLWIWSCQSRRVTPRSPSLTWSSSPPPWLCPSLSTMLRTWRTPSVLDAWMTPVEKLGNCWSRELWVTRESQLTWSKTISRWWVWTSTSSLLSWV